MENSDLQYCLNKIKASILAEEYKLSLLQNTFEETYTSDSPLTLNFFTDINSIRDQITAINLKINKLSSISQYIKKVLCK